MQPASGTSSQNTAVAASSTLLRRAPAGAHIDIDSRRLFGGTQEVRIQHLGQEYRLRQTRNGKLILTK